MRNKYKVLREVYEQRIANTSDRKADFIDDEHYQYEGVPYTIEAGFDYEEKAIDHRASIGHHGVTGHDVYGMRPVAVNWIEVTDDAGNIVTDPLIIKDASEYALVRGEEQASEQ
jgi:hypothetical protein